LPITCRADAHYGGRYVLDLVSTSLEIKLIWTFLASLCQFHKNNDIISQRPAKH
jgi:hypothetical protein